MIFDENGEIKVEYILLENLSENGKVKVKKGEKVNVVPKVIAAGKPLSKHDAVLLENFGLKYVWAFDNFDGETKVKVIGNNFVDINEYIDPAITDGLNIATQIGRASCRERV